MIAFRVDGLPPSLNHWFRTHWSERGRAARDWHAKVKLSALAQGVRVKPFQVPVVVRLTFFGPGDAANREKFVTDGLIPWLIADDGWPCVDELQLRSRPGKRSVLVEVWPASENETAPGA